MEDVLLKARGQFGPRTPTFDELTKRAERNSTLNVEQRERLSEALATHHTKLEPVHAAAELQHDREGRHVTVGWCSPVQEEAEVEAAIAAELERFRKSSLSGKMQSRDPSAIIIVGICIIFMVRGIWRRRWSLSRNRPQYC